MRCTSAPLAATPRAENSLCSSAVAALAACRLTEASNSGCECANAMLALEVRRRLMGLLPRRGLFLRRGSCRDTAGSTVVIMFDSDVVYHCLRVDVADLRTSYVVDARL